MKKITMEKLSPLFILTAVLLALAFTGSATTKVSADTASSTSSTTATYEFLLEKNISDNHPTQPYTADQFSFNVSGYGNVALTAYNDSYASATILLEAGDYTVEEVGPNGFVYDDWTVQWSGHGCQNKNGSDFETEMTVTDDESGNVCRADNQFRGEPEPILGCTDPDAINYDPAAEEDDGSCEYDNGGGGGDKTTLTVVKVVTGTSTTPDNFSFSINGGTAIAFEADGENEIELDAGVYSVTEVAVDGYNISYNNCTDITLNNGGNATCTITNTYDDGGNGGGGGGSDTYILEGYVWHDENENGVWEMEDEDPLEDWMVELSGDESATATTNSEGYYSFEVEAGTYTISEVVKDNWSQTFPSSPVTHTVTVPEDNEEVALGFPLNLFFTVAHAAVVDTYGDFNFGNVQFGQGGGGSGGGGGDDDDGRQILSTGSGGGGGTGGGSSPTPQVLGDQVSVVPMGAPNAGFGGAEGFGFNWKDIFSTIWHFIRPAR